MKHSASLLDDIADGVLTRVGVHPLRCEVKELRAKLKKAHGTVVELDGHPDSKPALLHAFSAALATVEPLRNWDALFDALTDSDMLPGQSTAIVIHGGQKLETALGKEHRTCVQVLNDAADALREREQRGLWFFWG